MNTFKTEKGTTLPLLNLQGKDYLAVAHRIQWFREEKPSWGIETELDVVADACVARAWIKDESGRIMAMAHKREDKQGFSDYIEKSETGAIGRALALVGYGTQFTSDLDEGQRLADAPAPRVAPLQTGHLKSVNATAAAPANPNAVYWITFGKYKNKAITSIPRDELANYLSWLETSATPERPLSDAAKAFLVEGDKYLQATAPKKMGDLPSASAASGTLKEIPMPTDQDMPAFHSDDVPF